MTTHDIIYEPMEPTKAHDFGFVLFGHVEEWSYWIHCLVMINPNTQLSTITANPLTGLAGRELRFQYENDMNEFIRILATGIP